MDEARVQPEQTPTLSGSLASIVEGVLGYANLPKMLVENTFKALSHLGTVPVALINGKALEISATSKARALLTTSVSETLAKRAAKGITDEMADIALHAHASKILRQQTNLQKIADHALLDLSTSATPGQCTSSDEISEDWLNAFEAEAANMSSEHMQRLFGKMLAGEIRQPATFSIRTVKLMSQLDNDVAVIFRKFCSYALHFEHAGRSLFVGYTPACRETLAHVHTFIPTADLVLLQEYGLIEAITIHQCRYDCAIPDADGRVLHPLVYLNQPYILMPIPPKVSKYFENRREWGVALSRVGNEIIKVVDPVENIDFTKEVFERFAKRGLEIQRIEKP